MAEYQVKQWAHVNGYSGSVLVLQVSSRQA